MKYLLDTNACIRYISGRSLPLRDKIISTPAFAIGVCSIVKAEMFYGSMKSHDPEESLRQQIAFIGQFQSLPFDDDAAMVFGRIRADLARRGTPIGSYDLQIAAIALAQNLIVVTSNMSEFNRVSGLMVEDWDI